MAENKWYVDIYGELLSVKFSPGQSLYVPGSPEEKAAFSRIELLFTEFHILETKRILAQVHRRMTGERLVAQETWGDPIRRRLNNSFKLGVRSGSLAIERVSKPKIVIPLEEVTEVVASDMRPQEVPEERLSTFEVCFLDESGEPIDGLEVSFTCRGKNETKKTDGDGVARFEEYEGGVGTLTVKDPLQLADIVEPRLEKMRPAANFDGTFRTMWLREELETVQMEAESRRYVVVRPEPGKIHVQLYDKTGQHVLGQLPYSIEGPVEFSGETSAEGMVLHPDVPAGDYVLTLTLNYHEDLRLAAEEVTVPLVVLDGQDGQAQVRQVGAVPQVRMGRLRGALFDLNKVFLLPTALEGLQSFRPLGEEQGPAKLLLVAHTDTSGREADNDALSLKRAESVQHFLQANHAEWLKNYETSIPQKARWGNREDRLMIVGIADSETRAREAAGITPSQVHWGDQGMIEWYQSRHNALVEEGEKDRPKLDKVDGIAGPKTREELVRDYMALAGEAWGAKVDAPLEIEVHGCGENFPLDGTGQELDDRAVAERDGERDRVDRRVEFFFFDAEFGPTPAVTGPSGSEYTVWREQARSNEDVAVEGVVNNVTKLPITDAHFRTGSAVMLPEGSAPAKDGKAPLTSVGALAVALRYNEERPGHRLLVAGHADSVGSDADNKTLSEKRAELVHAVLMGGDAGRETFKKLADETGKVSDWKQILAWASAAFPAIEELVDQEAEAEASSEDDESEPEEGKLGTGFGLANPGTIDDNPASAEVAVEAFQEAYNENYKLLGGSGTIGVDGEVGPQTWGAIYDLYQYNMGLELGETLEGVGKLREVVTFLPDVSPFIGFGESAPVDGVHEEDAEEQADRRVEVLFFAKGQEPDLALLAEDPEVSELYLNDVYVRDEVPSRPGGARKHWSFRLYLHRPSDVGLQTSYQLVHSGGTYDTELSETTSTPFETDIRMMEFPDVPAGGRLTLKRVGSGGVFTIFEEVLAQVLRGDISSAAPPEPVPLKAEPSTAFLDYSIEKSLS